MRMLLSLSVLALLAAGCASTSHFTAISSKSTDLSRLGMPAFESRGHVEARTCQGIVLAFYAGGAPKLEDALNEALAQTQSDLLKDATVTWSLFVGLIFSSECWAVSGDSYATTH